MRALVGHTKDVRAVDYLSDRRLVSGSSDRTVRIWNPVTGETLRTIKAGTPVYAVAASPDGHILAYAGRHPAADAVATPIQTFRLEKNLQGFTFRCPFMPPPPNIAANYPTGVPRSVWSLSFSADGRTFAAAGRVMGGGNIPNGGGGHWFRIGDASVHGPLATARAYALRFAHAGDGLAVTGDAVVEFYARPQDPEPVVAYPLQSQWAAAVAFVPGSPTAVVGVNTALYFVDSTVRKKPRKVKTGFRKVAAVATSADGKSVFVQGKPDGIEVYDPETGSLRVRYEFGLGGVHAIAVAPDGLTFAVAGDKGLAVFDWDG